MENLLVTVSGDKNGELKASVSLPRLPSVIRNPRGPAWQWRQRVEEGEAAWPSRERLVQSSFRAAGPGAYSWPREAGRKAAPMLAQGRVGGGEEQWGWGCAFRPCGKGLGRKQAGQRRPSP